MTIEPIRALREATPFRPFIMHLMDGREIEVVQRDYIALGPTGRTVAVILPNAELHIVDLAQVTMIDVPSQHSDRLSRPLTF